MILEIFLVVISKWIIYCPCFKIQWNNVPCAATCVALLWEEGRGLCFKDSELPPLKQLCMKLVLLPISHAVPPHISFLMLESGDRFQQWAENAQGCTATVKRCNKYCVVSSSLLPISHTVLWQFIAIILTDWNALFWRFNTFLADYIGLDFNKMYVQNFRGLVIYSIRQGLGWGSTLGQGHCKGWGGLSTCCHKCFNLIMQLHGQQTR